MWVLITAVTIPTRVLTADAWVAHLGSAVSTVIVVSNVCCLLVCEVEETPTLTVIEDVVVDAIDICFLFHENGSPGRGYNCCATPPGLAALASLVHLNPNLLVPIPILPYAFSGPADADANVCADVSGDLPILTHILFVDTWWIGIHTPLTDDLDNGY